MAKSPLWLKSMTHTTRVWGRKHVACRSVYARKVYPEELWHDMISLSMIPVVASEHMPWIRPLGVPWHLFWKGIKSQPSSNLSPQELLLSWLFVADQQRPTPAIRNRLALLMWHRLFTYLPQLQPSVRRCLFLALVHPHDIRYLDTNTFSSLYRCTRFYYLKWLKELRTMPAEACWWGPVVQGTQQKWRLFFNGYHMVWRIQTEIPLVWLQKVSYTCASPVLRVLVSHRVVWWCICYHQARYSYDNMASEVSGLEFWTALTACTEHGFDDISCEEQRMLWRLMSNMLLMKGMASLRASSTRWIPFKNFWWRVHAVPLLHLQRQRHMPTNEDI